MVDYIVVGLGLAGLSFCEQLERRGKTFVVISDDSEQSSKVAGGLYNPVILKRFTLAWKADIQMPLAMPFYAALEKKLNTVLDHKVPLLRKLASVEEQNNWFQAADKPRLSQFMVPKVEVNPNPHITAPHGLAAVAHTGRVDTGTLVDRYTAYLLQQQLLRQESFVFDALSFADDHVVYQDIKAKKIVFAEGFGLKKNPYFKYLPLNGTKGELLTIKAPLLKEERIVKSGVFIIPLGEDLYRVGATYKWKDKTNAPTQACKDELLSKLQTLINCPFTVVDHVAGIRPTVTDRRPLVGRHPAHNNLYVLNGFGSRGVLIAPYATAQLLAFAEEDVAIDPEMDIARFKKLYV